MKFRTSPVTKAYHIDALPFNVLVYGKGNIVALNLHGKALDEFIETHQKGN